MIHYNPCTEVIDKLPTVVEHDEVLVYLSSEGPYPKWPDIRLTLRSYADPKSDKVSVWTVSTDTGRPVTPVFTAFLALGDSLLNLNPPIEIAVKRMKSIFNKAHPTGCPSKGH